MTGLSNSTMTVLRKALAPRRAPVAKAMAGNGHALIRKSDAEKQVVWGEVYAPGFPDSQGDFMTAETIERMAWEFMRKQALHKIDVQHTQVETGSYVVESFIAREGDPTFIPGSWVIGVKIPDEQLWSLVKSGELNGFSLDGFAVKTEKTIQIMMPPVVKGETDVVEDHSHGFEVEFADDGTFLGGKTTPADDGHWHVIKSGTLTEAAGPNSHKHRFSFVEGILNVQNA